MISHQQLILLLVSACLAATHAGQCNLFNRQSVFGGAIHLRNTADSSGKNNTCHWNLPKADNYDKMRLVIQHVKMSGYSEVVVRAGPKGDVIVSITPHTLNNHSIIDTDRSSYSITVRTVNGSLNDLHVSYLSYNEIRANGDCPIQDKIVNRDDFLCSHMCVNNALKCDRIVNCPNGMDENRLICPRRLTSASTPIIVSLLVVLLIVAAVIVAYVCVRRIRHDQGGVSQPSTLFRYKIFKNSQEGVVESQPRV